MTRGPWQPDKNVSRESILSECWDEVRKASYVRRLGVCKVAQTGRMFARYKPGNIPFSRRAIHPTLLSGKSNALTRGCWVSGPKAPSFS